MSNPIYYSKFRFEMKGIESFRENFVSYYGSRLVCNVAARELYYQVLDYPRYVEKEKLQYRERIVSQKAMYLTDEDVENLKPYINALDFEPYRYRKVNWNDEGIKAIMEYSNLDFYGITDSYLPLIKVQMTISYWEEWPTGRLSSYIWDAFVNSGRLKPI